VKESPFIVGIGELSPVAVAVTVVVGVSFGKVGIAERPAVFSLADSAPSAACANWAAYSAGMAPPLEKELRTVPVNVTVSPVLDVELLKASKNKSLHEDIESKINIDTTAQNVIRNNLRTLLHIISNIA
jgi:hypothetical protein